jgi:hypothetical protein
MARPNALKWYDGPSLVDGSPIIGVVSGLQNASRNLKTGDLFQTWIMPRDVKPNDAVKTGDDRGVCADCRMRPKEHKLLAADDPFRLLHPCYVKTFQGPRSVWQGTHDLPVASVDDIVNGANRRTGLRFGAWGDPASIPLVAWQIFLRVMHASIDLDRSPGYTHQWETCDPLWARYVMASVHSSDERRRAKGRGFRTFRIITDLDDLESGEVLCVHVTHGTQCVDCGLCDGSNLRPTMTGAMMDGRKDVAIYIHR